MKIKRSGSAAWAGGAAGAGGCAVTASGSGAVISTCSAARSRGSPISWLSTWGSGAGSAGESTVGASVVSSENAGVPTSMTMNGGSGSGRGMRLMTSISRSTRRWMVTDSAMARRLSGSRQKPNTAQPPVAMTIRCAPPCVSKSMTRTATP